MVIRRYLTKRPEQNKNLKDIWLCIWKCKFETIKQRLDD